MSSKNGPAAAPPDSQIAALRSHIATLPAAERAGAYAAAAKAALAADEPAVLRACLRAPDGAAPARGFPGLELALAAATHGSPAAVAALLDHGGLDPADPPSDLGGANFLNFCVGTDNLPALRYLVQERGYALADFGPKYGAFASPLLADAVLKAAPATVAFLMDEVGARPEPHGGLLHLAVGAGRVEMARWLMERGVAGKDDLGQPCRTVELCTPLQAAAVYRSLEGLRFLLDEGADVTRLDVAGRDVFERSRFLDVPGRAEWPELAIELRQRGLLALFGRE